MHVNRSCLGVYRQPRESIEMDVHKSLRELQADAIVSINFDLKL